MSDLSPEERAELRRLLLCGRASFMTGGPWHSMHVEDDPAAPGYCSGEVYDTTGEYTVAHNTIPCTADLIAEAVNALPRLLDQVERLEAANAELLAELHPRIPPAVFVDFNRVVAWAPGDCYKVDGHRMNNLALTAIL